MLAIEYTPTILRNSLFIVLRGKGQDRQEA